MKNTPMDLELTSEIVPIDAPSIGGAKRFQVTVEYAAGVFVTNAVAESAEEGVKAFMVQAPGCEEGEIALFDRDERRVVASVKWKMDTTGIGLRVPHRQNVFHHWELALIAYAIQGWKWTSTNAKQCSTVGA